MAEIKGGMGMAFKQDIVKSQKVINGNSISTSEVSQVYNAVANKKGKIKKSILDKVLHLFTIVAVSIIILFTAELLLLNFMPGYGYGILFELQKVF